MTTPEYGSLRSDDDHWDIVSNVGYTALLVAGWRALHTTGPKPLVQDEYAKHFITASADPYLEGLLANRERRRTAPLSLGSTACKPGFSTTSSTALMRLAYDRR